MADTLNNLVNDVTLDLGSPPTGIVSFGTITNRINKSYREVATRYRHPELESSETITTVASTATDALPSDYWYTVGMRDETNDKVLKYRTLNWILAQDRDTEGQPKYYTQYGSNLLFHPIPDDAYSLTHYYIIQITALSSGSDSTVLNDAWDEIIEWGAVWRIHQALGEQDRMIHARNIWRTLVNSMPETEVLTAEQANQIVGLMDSAIPAENTE